MKTIISLKTALGIEGERGRTGPPKKSQPAPKLGMLIREARLQKGYTQEELAQKCGTDKAYISKVENDAKDLRFSTLKKLVEEGLGGQFNIIISL